MKKHQQPKKFSSELEGWLKSRKAKTFDSLIEFSKDKSFAITLLILMFLPALPLPTGGITHIFEIIAALIAIEMIAGFKTIWLPNSVSKLKLGDTLKGKVIPAMLSRIKWLEKHSSPRAKWIFGLPLANQALGIVILVFIVTAFFSPPFSGLDTLPALGVVAISLAIIMDDAMVLLAGIIIGSLGVVLSIGLGELVVRTIHSLLN